MVNKKSTLMRDLLERTANFNIPEREAVVVGLLQGKKSTKGRFRPLNMGTEKPALLTRSEFTDKRPTTKTHQAIRLFRRQKKSFT